MDIYKLTKQEYKKVVKEFVKTFYGRNLYIASLSSLIIEIIFCAFLGYNLGYNSALNSEISLSNFGYVCLIIAIISLFAYLILTLLFNIEVRKYYERKKD